MQSWRGGSAVVCKSFRIFMVTFLTLGLLGLHSRTEPFSRWQHYDSYTSWSLGSPSLKSGYALDYIGMQNMAEICALWGVPFITNEQSCTAHSSEQHLLGTFTFCNCLDVMFACIYSLSPLCKEHYCTDGVH
jgi:hypothetical protein